MSLMFRLLYRIHWTPWVREQPGEPLRKLVQGKDALTPGAALDLGCGVGTDAVFLATADWNVTAVDSAPKALALARRRPGAERVRWVRGDVTRLISGPGDAYDLILDIGCFHGLSDQDRAACSEGVTRLATPGALLLLFAFPPGRRPAHRGISQEELVRHFAAGWDLLSAEPELSMRLGEAHPAWYQLRRRG